MSEPAELLLAHWAAQEPLYEREVVHGEREVRALEARYRVVVPPLFRSYLLRACSTFDDGGLMDGSSSAWWGLDRIDRVTGEYEYDLTDPVLAGEASSSLLFADYMIWSMAWAISCGPGPNYGRVFVVTGVADRFVADDFGAFVRRYIQRFPEIL